VAQGADEIEWLGADGHTFLEVGKIIVVGIPMSELNMVWKCHSNSEAEMRRILFFRRFRLAVPGGSINTVAITLENLGAGKSLRPILRHQFQSEAANRLSRSRDRERHLPAYFLWVRILGLNPAIVRQAVVRAHQYHAHVNCVASVSHNDNYPKFKIPRRS
jgi:hypothetical protein